MRATMISTSSDRRRLRAVYRAARRRAKAHRDRHIEAALSAMWAGDGRARVAASDAAVAAHQVIGRLRARQARSASQYTYPA